MYNIDALQPKVIYYLSYPEKLFIAFLLVLFWYLLCCVIKREIKKQEKEDKKECKNFLWRLMR